MAYRRRYRRVATTTAAAPPPAASFTGALAVERFDSPRAFASACAGIDPRYHVTERARETWASGNAGSTWADYDRDCRDGNVSNIKAASDLLEKIAVNVETDTLQWQASPAGAYPMVPDYLAGRPDCMRRRIPAQSERAPIRLYVDMVSSAAIDTDTLVKRGVSFLALAMALARTRPVELYAAIPVRVSETRKDHVTVVRIPTAPLNLAVASAMFTSGGIIRTMGYRYASARCGDRPNAVLHWLGGTMPEWYTDPAQYLRAEGAYTALLRTAIGVGPEDFVMPPTHGSDPSVKDPIAFVQAAVDRFAGRER